MPATYHNSAVAIKRKAERATVIKKMFEKRQRRALTLIRKKNRRRKQRNAMQKANKAQGR